MSRSFSSRHPGAPAVKKCRGSQRSLCPAGTRHELYERRVAKSALRRAEWDEPLSHTNLGYRNGYREGVVVVVVVVDYLVG